MSASAGGLLLVYKRGADSKHLKGLNEARKERRSYYRLSSCQLCVAKDEGGFQSVKYI